MTSRKKITCILCPIGCKIVVQSNGKTAKILEGNKCKKGIEYAYHEALDPKRMLTSSVKVIHGEWPLVSVKSSKPVPKKYLFDILNDIKQTSIKAPITIGQIIIENAGKHDISIIATRNVKKVQTE